MDRLIEKNRTYRVPHENGETKLYQVLEVGKSLKVKDLKSGTVKQMDRSSFQKRLNAGEIYVSANLMEVLKKIVN